MPSIGLQLYTLRDDLKADFEGTIRAVAQMATSISKRRASWASIAP